MAASRSLRASFIGTQEATLGGFLPSVTGGNGGATTVGGRAWPPGREGEGT